MKVFQIRPNSEHYQYFVPRLGDDDINAPLPEGDELLAMLYIEEPRLYPTDFYNHVADFLITSPRATEALREHLDAAGIMRSFTYEGQIYAFTDVTRYLDVLDEEQGEFLVEPTSGARLRIKRYAFYADRFPPRTSLFKMKSHDRHQIYVREGGSGFAREFHEICVSEGLVGLEFREIWNNEQEPDYRGTPWGIMDYLMSPEDKKMHDQWEKEDAEKRSS